MLETLTSNARTDALKRERLLPFRELEKRLDTLAPARDVYTLLRPERHIKIIAEIKRASPSRGDLALISDPVSLAECYETNGAHAISVLTEGRAFKGSLEDLRKVSERVSVPVLRKDFLSERYQVLEARVNGADFVLLIVAALDDATLRELYEYAHELGMAVLVETHSESEILRALDIGARMIGVNARNLSTFELDKTLFARVRHLIPDGVIAVAESAVNTVDDVRLYAESGAHLVLVGEALVTGDAPVLLTQFLEVPRGIA